MGSESPGDSCKPSEAKKRRHLQMDTSEGTHGIQMCQNSNTLGCCFLRRDLRLYKVPPHNPVFLSPPVGYQNWKVVNVLQTGNMYDIQFQHPKLKNNCTYQGSMQDNKAKGLGTYTSANGEKYQGFWKDGMRNGQGTFTRLDDKHTIKYEGCFKNSYPHGQGTLISSPSGTYEGEWSKGNRHGQGKETLLCGCTYEGTFHTNQLSGKGILFPAMGGSVKAHFTNGQITKDSAVTITYKNGDKYEGNWTEGFMSGTGIYTRPGVYQYDGLWEKSKYHGKGKLTWADSEYVGEFVEGKKHGHGTFTYPDGSKYVGEWQNDFKHGVGKIIEADGSSAGLGRWENAVCRRMLHNTVSVDNPEQAYPACTICAAAPVDMVVYPCAHMHFCSTCIDQWLNHWKKRTCPSCKEHVTGTQRIFLP